NLRDGVFLGDTHLLDDIKARIVKTLVEDAKLPPNDVDFDRPIEELGIKSADAVYMCGILEEVFGIEIDPSLIFESNTLAAFAKEIAETAGQDK
ncbi:MAG: acyl carrier protein, partial [Pseudomonadota bacterium]